jgi:hypothetical protein
MIADAPIPAMHTLLTAPGAQVAVLAQVHQEAIRPSAIENLLESSRAQGGILRLTADEKESQ